MSPPVQQAPGLWRTDLQEHDLSVPGREVIQNRVELAPEAPYVRHKHPGEEIIYVLEGTLKYDIDGQPSITAGAGEALTVPANTVHAVRNIGTANASSSRRMSSRRASRSSSLSTEHLSRGRGRQGRDPASRATQLCARCG